METELVLLNEENKVDFEKVFPKEIELTDLRVAIGAADENGVVLGAASYVLSDYEYNLDWIFVEPAARLSGVGTKLIEKIFDIMMKTGYVFPLTARFEFLSDAHDGDSLHTFFLSIRSMTTSFSHDRYYITKNDIRNSKEFHHFTKSDMYTKGFFDKTEAEQKMILSMLQREHTYEVADYQQWKRHCVPELCKCIYVRNNLVDLIFIQELPDHNLELAYLYGKYPQGLFELLYEIVTEIEALFPEADLTFEAMNDESVKLAEHLFPRARKAHIYEATL